MVNDLKTLDTTQERTIRAKYLDERIGISIIDLAVNLKEMRDYHLYSDLGFETLNDYIKDRIPYSLSFVQSLLTLTDKSKDVDLSSYSCDQIRQLARIAEESDVSLVSGQNATITLEINGNAVELSPDDALDELKKQAKKEFKKEKIKLEKASNELQKQLRESEKTIEVQNRDMTVMRETVEYITSLNGQDESYLATIATHKGATTRIVNIISDLSKHISDINQIDPNIRNNPDIVAQVYNLYSMLNVSRLTLYETWGGLFYDLTGKQDEPDAT